MELLKTNTFFKFNTYITKKNFNNILMCIFGFFIGRISFFSFLNPLSVAYVALFLFKGYVFYFVLISTSLGILTTFVWEYIAKYFICLSFMFIGSLLFKKLFKKTSVLDTAIFACISVFFTFIFVMFLTNFNLYFFTIYFLEAILVFTISFVLKKAIDVFESNQYQSILTNEEILSISIVLGAVIAGACDIYIGVISFRDLFSSIMILIIAYKGGISLAATSGIIIGIILTITNTSTENIINILAISGLASGFGKKNKYLTSLIFVIFRLGVSFFVYPLDFDSDLVFSILLSIVFFLAIDDSFYFNFAADMHKKFVKEQNYINKIKDVTIFKLQDICKSFSKLSTTFNNLSEKKLNLTQEDISNLIDDVASKVCSNCSLNIHCWKKNFYATYQSSFTMLQNFEEKGQILTNQIPKDFLNTCTNIVCFVDNLIFVYEKYKNDLTWHNKLIKSRELVSSQLLGICQIITDISHEINFDINFNEELEAKLINEFELKKIKVENILVFLNKFKKQEIVINFSKYIEFSKIEKEVLNIVCQLTSKKFKKLSFDYEKFVLILVEEQNLNVTSSICKIQKTNSIESGDSYSILPLKNGQYMLALSDGMGSGCKAKEESNASIELLEQFVESGFSKDLAIKIINSILVLKGTKESFSTLDICYINTYTSVAEFLKIGASTTFLLRNGRVQLIKSSSLPLGILNDVDIESTSKKLKDGDILVMVTDGVLEISLDEFDKENWLINLLENIDIYIPENIASLILEKAKSLSNNIIKDDMTVLVSRVWQKFV